MEFVINRILFSLFCMENGIAAFFDNHIYKRFIICLCRILYKYDPFRNIRRNYVSFDEYPNWKKRAVHAHKILIYIKKESFFKKKYHKVLAI